MRSLIRFILSGCAKQYEIAIGRKAPEFTAQAAQQDQQFSVSLRDLLRDHEYVVLFFYPKDFTFVCPTEMRGLQAQLATFAERKTAVFGISGDDVETHLRWLATPQADGGIQGIEFPLLADPGLKIAKKFGVVSCDGTLALRATFIIAKDGIIRAMTLNDDAVGRNIEEYVRMIDALNFYKQTNGLLCPANWRPGEPGIKVPGK